MTAPRPRQRGRAPAGTALEPGSEPGGSRSESQSYCASHANGSAAGTTTDCSWGENQSSLCQAP